MGVRNQEPKQRDHLKQGYSATDQPDNLVPGIRGLALGWGQGTKVPGEERTVQ